MKTQCNCSIALEREVARLRKVLTDLAEVISCGTPRKCRRETPCERCIASDEVQNNIFPDGDE